MEHHENYCQLAFSLDSAKTLIDSESLLKLKYPSATGSTMCYLGKCGGIATIRSPSLRWATM